MIRFPQERLFLVTLAAFLIFAALFTETLVFAHLNYDHAGHDHSGENCPVCLRMETARGLFKSPAPVVFFPWPEGCAAVPEGVSFFSGLFLPDPVSLKVRLNS
jgi:hypothetical protein